MVTTESQPAQFKVRNWEQFQHYKDRNPPWIKLHFALLASEDWVTLDDASKLLAVVCMLIASRNGGMIPNKPDYLKRVAYLDRLPKLKPLIDCGFLEIPQASASAMQAPASTLQANARPETETETEKKEPLSETSSDQPKVPRKKTAYSQDFEAFWVEYPRTPNMGKSEAYAEWRKLGADDRVAARAAVPSYKAFLASKPDLSTLHACRFLSKRRFDGFAELSSQAEANRDQWASRLEYGRKHRKWSAGWGEKPGLPGCRAPADLILQDDGVNWVPMEAGQ